MRVACTRGLFVGVDGFNSSRNHLAELEHAPGDALRLKEYLEAADPCGSWTCLPGKDATRPTRSAIIDGLHRLAREVPEEGAGLFHFSGHGIVTDSGLVLAPADFEEDYPVDTGLTLHRILSILKSVGRGKRFVVLLDCCRESEGATLSDDVSANACILYACAGGEVTLEGDQGGLFTQAILACLRGVAAATGRSTFCSVRDLYKRLPRHALGWRSLNHELHGNWSDQILIPSVNDTASLGRNRIANCILEYRFRDEPALQNLYDRLGSEILWWYNISPDTETSEALLREAIRRPEDLILRLHLPDGGLHWHSGELIEALIGPIPDSPSIIFEWPYPIPRDVILALGRAIRADSLALVDDDEDDQDNFILRWENRLGQKLFYGCAIVSLHPGGPTRIRLSCQNKEGRIVSSRNLLPSLVRFHDLFRYAHVTRAGGEP